jgi:hypothetical protein
MYQQDNLDANFSLYTNLCLGHIFGFPRD